MSTRIGFICSAFLIAAFALFPLTITGQGQSWKLAPDGRLTIESPGYKEEQQQCDTEQLRWVSLILVGILVLLGLRMYTGRTKSGQFSQEEITILRKQRLLMIQELARLDQQYALGNMPESLYSTERRQYKQLLTELTILCKIS
ncbi:MAG: hypothetical protein RBT80_10030 [Candidatus Vecturithrix sp.]|jgi:hypothetical protein|nr:hypothetical protein [Candidatus Vecturithrix sp.]